MSTVEHLFMQIFERKDWIANQQRQQLQSYCQSMASNLLAAGVPPPLWLWSTGSDNRDGRRPQEFSREQRISGILYGVPCANTPWVSQSILFNNPVLKADNKPDSSFTETCISNQYFVLEDKDKPVGHSYSDGRQHQDMAAEPKIVEAYSERHLPAIVQLSELRQRDVELSVGKEAKTEKHSNPKSNIKGYTGPLTRSRIPSTQTDHIKKSSGLKKMSCSHLDYVGRVTRSRSGAHQRDYVDTLPKSSKLSNLVVEDSIQKALETQPTFHPVQSIRVENHLSTNPNVILDKQMNLIIASDAACYARRELDTTSHVASETQFDPNVCVEYRQPVFDDIGMLAPIERYSATLGKEKNGKESTAENSNKAHDASVIGQVHDSSDAACYARRELNTLSNVAFEPQLDPNVCVEPRQLVFDGIEMLAPIERYSATLRKEKKGKESTAESSNTAHDSLVIGQVHEIFQSAEVTKKGGEGDRDFDGGPEDGRFELPEKEGSEYTTNAMSCDNFSHVLQGDCDLRGKEQAVTALLSFRHTLEVEKTEIGNVVFDSKEHNSEDSQDLMSGGVNISGHECSGYGGYSIGVLEERNLSRQVVEDCIQKALETQPTFQPVPSVRVENHFSTSANGILYQHMNSMISSDARDAACFALKKDVAFEPHIDPNVCVEPRQLVFDGIEMSSPIEIYSATLGKEKNGKDSTPENSIKAHDSSVIGQEHEIFQSAEVTKRAGEGDKDFSEGPEERRFELPEKEGAEYNTDAMSCDNMSHVLQRDRDLGGKEQAGTALLSFRHTHEVETTELVNVVLDSKEINSEDCQDLMSGGGNMLGHECSRSGGYSIGFIEERNLDNGVQHFSHDSATSSLSHKLDMVVPDDTIPELERFSIEIDSIRDGTMIEDSNLPCLTREPASVIEQLCGSSSVLTPLPFPSSKHKIHNLPDSYQSLPDRLEGCLNLSNNLYIHGIVSEQRKPSDYGKLSYLNCKLDAEFDGSLLGRFSSQSMLSFAALGCDSRRPYTPPVEKHLQRFPSEISGASSDKVGSNPELICFRIDENTSTIEEDDPLNDLQDTSQECLVSRENKTSGKRKALTDLTSVFQNAPTVASTGENLLDRGSLDSVQTEFCFQSQMDGNQILQNGYGSDMRLTTENKENHAIPLSRNKEKKAVDLLPKRSSRLMVSSNASEHNRSCVTVEKGSKPGNIVSNIESFIPLVRQNQEAARITGKRDIKVKSLEAAEAAKRLEEKKENERKMRKEAAKLERLKLEKENVRQLELKQKQKEEEKKIKEGNIAVRKRQREEEEKKEQQRKRRHIEGQRLRKAHEERLRGKAVDGKQWKRKECAEKAKRQQKSDRARQVSVIRNLVEADQSTTKVVDPRNGSSKESCDVSMYLKDFGKVVQPSDGLQNPVGDRVSIIKESRESQSYEISPYRDSDEEDGEEDNRCKKKFIPSWARRESLNQLLFSKQHIDPAIIFCRKKSFSLSEVLSVPARPRPL